MKTSESSTVRAADMESKATLVAPEVITQRIALLRGQKVLLDSDLAALYDVSTKRFNEQVKRNLARFPADFMFQLTEAESESLRSQIATSNDKAEKRGGRRYLPYVFTEHGAIMAATILSSPRAIEVSVYVVRAFVQLREALSSHRVLAQRLETLEHQLEAQAARHDDFANTTRSHLKQVFDAIRLLMEPPEKTPKRSIGFVTPDEKPKAKAARKR